MPWTKGKWIFVDRNSVCLTVKEREGRTALIKELSSELLGILDTERDITVFRAENLPTSLFPARPLPAAITQLLDSSHIPDLSDATIDGVIDDRVKRITSCIKDTCKLFELISYASKDRVVVCMLDGLGSSAGLVATFAAACNQESSFILIIYFSTMEASVYTKDYPDVPSTREWKDSCERGGNLISWTEHHIWIRLSSNGMQAISSK
jgi:hypothetical protein